VAAVEFEASWLDVLKEFNQLPSDKLVSRVCEELTSKQSRREVERFSTEICDDDFSRLAGPVTELLIPL
jgi:hypothetical protein